LFPRVKTLPSVHAGKAARISGKKRPKFREVTKVSLVDGVQLASLMIEHDLGVSLVGRYDHKRVVSDFFIEE
jgi:restriction endonuclease Mrr